MAPALNGITRRHSPQFPARTLEVRHTRAIVHFDRMTASDLVRGLRNTELQVTEKASDMASDYVSRLRLLRDAIAQGDYSHEESVALSKEYLHHSEDYEAAYAVLNEYRTFENSASVRFPFVHRASHFPQGSKSQVWDIISRYIENVETAGPEGRPGRDYVGRTNEFVLWVANYIEGRDIPDADAREFVRGRFISQTAADEMVRVARLNATEHMDPSASILAVSPEQIAENASL